MSQKNRKKKEGINRRQFLRIAGMATAGAAVSSAAGCRGAGSGSADSLAGGEIEFTKETDALVIGSGGAGLWATYELTKAGVSTLVVEKEPSWGGDTILACGVLPVHGTVVQEQQGIEDLSPEETWEAYKERYADARVPELHKTVYLNAPRAINIWTEEFGVEWMPMDPDSYTKFFHIFAPGMQNDHLGFEKIYNFCAESNEFMFETRAMAFIIDQDDRPVGLRVRDEVTGEYTDIRFKKCLLATGDWVSNQEMIAKYLPSWTKAPAVTNASMGEGIQMAQALGAETTSMDSVANLMSDFAPVVVWGFYESLIHVFPNGERICNENAIFNAPGLAHEEGYTFWWSVFDEALPEGYFKNSYQTRAKRGNVVTADTVEELAAKMMVPVETLKATVEKYNTDAEAGEDTVFGKSFGFTPLKAPFYALKNRVVRYKTNGGLRIDKDCRVLNRFDEAIPNVYAAGSCQGETTPNVHDVSAIGMHAGQVMAAELTEE